MLDINKAIKDARLLESDPEGNLFDLDHWSPLVAQQLARAEGIILSDEHWEVIIYLRERYRMHGMADSARHLLGELEEKFCDGRGRKELYVLFPGGPDNTGQPYRRLASAALFQRSILRQCGVAPYPHSDRCVIHSRPRDSGRCLLGTLDYPGCMYPGTLDR